MRYETLANCTFNYCVLFRMLQVHVEMLFKYLKTLAFITPHFMRLHFLLKVMLLNSEHNFCFTNTVCHYAGKDCLEHRIFPLTPTVGRQL